MAPIKQIAEAHPGLVAKLRKFSGEGASQFAAGLALIPQLHAQTIRIEVLQQLIAAFASGSRLTDRDTLAEWTGNHLTDSPCGRHEDPVEDAFIGCVNTPFGSFDLPLGIFANVDFWVERLFNFLYEKQNVPLFADIVNTVIPLLRLSDALIRRTGLERYTAGGGKRAEKIIVPRWRDLQPVVAATKFNDDDLAAIGLVRRDFAAFVLTGEHRQALPHENLWSSSFERRPLLDTPGGIIVAMPSSLGRSALRFMTEGVIRSGLGGWADMFFQQEAASIFVNEVANRLRIEPTRFDRPTPPDSTPNLYPFFGMFDIGKPAILLTYCPTFLVDPVDYSGYDRLTDEGASALNDHILACASEFEQMPGFSGGLILVSVVAPLRVNLFGLTPPSGKWKVHACTLPDWLNLTKTAECTAMRLWKLGDHEEQIARTKAHILNPSGLINLFPAWQNNGYRLLPRDKDARGLTMLTFESTFAMDLRLKARRREDARTFGEHGEDGFVSVIRHNSSALFDEDVGFRLYVSPKAVSERNLVGFVDEGNMGWWVRLSGADAKPERRSLVFQLWECVFHWVGRVSKVLLGEWPKLRTRKSIEIVIHLPQLPDWTENRAVPSDEISMTAQAVENRIVVSLPEGFIQQFHTPKNIAERKIVESLIKGTAILIAKDSDNLGIAGLVNKIVRNDDARYFHVVQARRLEQLFGGDTKPEPLFVADEDFSLSELGLAFLAPSMENVDRVEGKEQCLGFLKEIVEKLWERIESQLSAFAHLSVLEQCLEQLDENVRDEERWDMTARAQFALRDDVESVHHVLHARRAQRDRATLCNRLLIETSQYSCKTGVRLFTRADHLTLLADMAVLILLAHHRDAIAYGFMEPVIRVFPNGEIAVDESFYDTSFGRYVDTRAQKLSEDAVASYEDFFPKPAKPIDADLSSFVAQIDKAFVPEYGFSVSDVFKVIDEMKALAVKTKHVRGVLAGDGVEMLLGNSGLDPNQSKSFIERFSLPIRSMWNKDLPAGCRQEDVFPWRFRRQLSLLARPMVQIQNSADRWILSATMIEKGLMYFLSHIERASFPRAFFRSREMIRFLGETVNRRGHEFAAKVHSQFLDMGFSAEPEVEMTKIGAPKKAGLGDLDVLAWDMSSGNVFPVECKRLLPAITVREVIQRLEDFQGDRVEKDDLARHLRRIDWLEQNVDAVVWHTGIAKERLKIIPLLVTSEIVPMQFFSNAGLNPEQIIPFDVLRDKILKKWPVMNTQMNLHGK